MKKDIRNVLFKTAIGYSAYKSVKYIYYSIWSLATVVNYYLVRLRGNITNVYKNKKLHLGCGNVYLEGWVNIDNYIGGRRHKDLWLDVANGLPFKNSEIEAIFTSHTLEHFIIEDISRILEECHRVLRPSGFLRIAVPSMTMAMDAYFKGDGAMFDTQGRTISRKFIDWILYHNTHLTMFDFPFMRELLEDAGFQDICEVRYRESRYFDAKQLLEMDKYEEQTMFVECVK